MSKQSDDRNNENSREEKTRGEAKPPHGQGHQPLPGEEGPQGEDAKRKRVQNADLPPGQGHQPLPGEDASDGGKSGKN